MKKRTLAILGSVLAMVACQAEKEEQGYDFESQPYAITYEYQPGNFCNPERGAYSNKQLTFKNGKMSGLPTTETMHNARKVGTTLLYTGIYLCDFMDGPISDEALDYIKQYFINLRGSGCKAVLRCAYSWENIPGVEQNPKLEVMLTHISQLKPILQEYWDVIYIWQSGFLGPWGEWHSYSNITEQDKSTLVKAQLEALPKNRQIAIRTARAKRQIFDTSLEDTITVETAFNGSDNSRLAGHNDCFLASANDVGTYLSASERSQWKTESKYTAMGGESCFVDNSENYCQCQRSAEELEAFHWSYLSNHPSIIEIWKVGDCYDNLSSRVGYRFSLIGSRFKGKFKAGNEFNINFTITNYGFASLINERKMEFIIENVNDKSEKYVYVSETDPRIWQGGHTYNHTETITLPTELKEGEWYNIYIAMPDISPNLHDNPEYSVRFANKGVWDEEQGYNLMAKIKVQ